MSMSPKGESRILPVFFFFFRKSKSFSVCFLLVCFFCLYFWPYYVGPGNMFYFCFSGFHKLIRIIKHRPIAFSSIKKGFT